MSEENYYKLKIYLESIDINFKQLDIINNDILGMYDYIYLSNIIDYYDKQVYKNKIEKLKCLKEGVLVLTYLYNFTSKKEEFYKSTFSSKSYIFQKLNNRDAVMIYKK